MLSGKVPSTPASEGMLLTDEDFGKWIDKQDFKEIKHQSMALLQIKAQLAKATPMIEVLTASKYEDEIVKVREQERKEIGELMMKHVKAEPGLPPRWIADMLYSLKRGVKP